MNARLPAAWGRKKSGWIGLLCGLAIVLSGCRFNPEAANRIASTRLALMPTETPAPPPPFLALCLVKATAQQNMRMAPDDSAKVVGTVANRGVISVTFRSPNAIWVYGMNASQVSGWVAAASVACTVPIEELVVPTPTPGPIMPTPVITMTATTGATPSSEITLALATATATPLVLAPTATKAATATPANTATSAATATPLLPTATSTPATAPELQCSVLITQGLNVRRGPSTNFAAFYRLDQGDVFAAVGRSVDGRWLGGRIVATNQAGWIIISSVSCNGNIETLVTLENDVLPLSEATATLPAATLPAATPTAIEPTATARPTTATEAPTELPTETPTTAVTVAAATAVPATRTATPSATARATATPTPSPTKDPTVTPTAVPPTATPTARPTLTPTPSPTKEPTVTSTAVPPTATPTARPTLTPTPSPTKEPTVTPTAVPPTATPSTEGTLQCEVASPTGVYVRSGPSRAFEPFGVAKFGESFVATRRSANNEWLLGTSESGFTGWVVAGGMNCVGPLRNLPVIDPQIAQTPLPPSGL